VSKAFTRESDESGEELPSFRPQLPPGARNYITRRGADQLKDKLDQLLQKRSAWSAAAKNAGTAWEADRQTTEAVIRRIQLVLQTMVVAEIPANPQKIAFGAEVTLRRGNGEEEVYQIVGVEETDPEKGLISWISPLARALLSHKAGEKVRFASPAGNDQLTILRVHYPAT
jgi:transcription elongation factor GreB